MGRTKNPDPSIKRKYKKTVHAAILRVGGRTKKAKVVFDPSESNAPKKRNKSANSSGYTSSDSKKPRTSSSSGIKGIRGRKPKSRENIKEKIPKTTSEVASNSNRAPVLEPQVNICMSCLKVDGKKFKKLITCKECNYRVHIGCLKISYQNLNLVEQLWKCRNCRTCVVCYETSEAGPMAICSVCVDAYHLTCHKPKILSQNYVKYKWECYKCKKIGNKGLSFGSEYEKITHQSIIIENLEKPMPPLESILLDPVIPTSTPKEDKSAPKLKAVTENIQPSPLSTFNGNDNEIPDISQWSCENVYNYMQKFFPNEAHVFKEQEIDGPSLLLIKRSDIVQNFRIRLGPAIRIYSQIVKLQTRSNDFQQTWM